MRDISRQVREHAPCLRRWLSGLRLVERASSNEWELAHGWRPNRGPSQVSHLVLGYQPDLNAVRDPNSETSTLGWTVVVTKNKVPTMYLGSMPMMQTMFDYQRTTSIQTAEITAAQDHDRSAIRWHSMALRIASQTGPR